ncbi:hypothetical protein, partial [Nocardia cyriacigeorgica]|uniref:hypothetical protein n=1 Tax=Nocardia cyriacigeorgica TaxID=135487 RepID=UPI002455C25D
MTEEKSEEDAAGSAAATMDGANEAGRAAANPILHAAGDPAPRAVIHPLVELPIFAAAKRLDADRFRAGLP